MLVVQSVYDVGSSDSQSFCVASMRVAFTRLILTAVMNCYPVTCTKLVACDSNNLGW